jgi:hypothetical protein
MKAYIVNLCIASIMYCCSGSACAQNPFGDRPNMNGYFPNNPVPGPIVLFHHLYHKNHFIRAEAIKWLCIYYEDPLINKRIKRPVNSVYIDYDNIHLSSDYHRKAQLAKGDQLWVPDKFIDDWLAPRLVEIVDTKESMWGGVDGIALNLLGRLGMHAEIQKVQLPLLKAKNSGTIREVANNLLLAKLIYGRKDCDELVFEAALMLIAEATVPRKNDPTIPMYGGNIGLTLLKMCPNYFVRQKEIIKICQSNSKFYAKNLSAIKFFENMWAFWAEDFGNGHIKSRSRFELYEGPKVEFSHFTTDRNGLRRNVFRDNTIIPKEPFRSLPPKYQVIKLPKNMNKKIYPSSLHPKPNWVKIKPLNNLLPGENPVVLLKPLSALMKRPGANLSQRVVPGQNLTPATGIPLPGGGFNQRPRAPFVPGKIPGRNPTNFFPGVVPRQPLPGFFTPGYGPSRVPRNPR